MEADDVEVGPQRELALPVRQGRERRHDEERPLDPLHLLQRVQERERLRRLAEAHLVAKDHVPLEVPIEAQPVEAVDLVGPELPPTGEGWGLRQLGPALHLRLLLLRLLLLLLRLLSLAPLHRLEAFLADSHRVLAIVVGVVVAAVILRLLAATLLRATRRRLEGGVLLLACGVVVVVVVVVGLLLLVVVAVVVGIGGLIHAALVRVGACDPPLVNAPPYPVRPQVLDRHPVLERDRGALLAHRGDKVHGHNGRLERGQHRHVLGRLEGVLPAPVVLAHLVDPALCRLVLEGVAVVVHEQ